MLCVGWLVAGPVRQPGAGRRRRGTILERRGQGLLYAGPAIAAVATGSTTLPSGEGASAGATHATAAAIARAAAATVATIATVATVAATEPRKY